MKALYRTITAFLFLANSNGTGWAEPIAIETSTAVLHAEVGQIDRPTNRVGSLVFRGGLDLTSPDPRFGGLSGLAVSTDGRRLTAVTDRGDWISFRPIVSPRGQLTGIADAQIGRLRNRYGNPLNAKHNSDAESITTIDGGFAVSFEHRHRLWLYRGAPDPFRARPTDIPLPPLSRAMSANKGIESFARLHDGRLVAIAENTPKDAPFTQGWIFGANKWHGFRYRRHARFLPAGAATLPDGRLVVVERRFSYIGGFGTRLVAITPASIKPAAEITGRELARLEPPLISENFEGIASYREAFGDATLYLISDDNFIGLQKTTLLKFALRE